MNRSSSWRSKSPNTSRNAARSRLEAFTHRRGGSTTVIGRRPPRRRYARVSECERRRPEEEIRSQVQQPIHDLQWSAWPWPQCRSRCLESTVLSDEMPFAARIAGTELCRHGLHAGSKSAAAAASFGGGTAKCRLRTRSRRGSQQRRSSAVEWPARRARAAGR